MGTTPMQAEQLLEGSRRPALRAAHERTLVSPSDRHPVPTVRRIRIQRSMPVIRGREQARSRDLVGPGGRIQTMNRRSFLIAASVPLIAASVPRSLRASPTGGGTVALVTADLESHLVAVETTTGRIVKRIATAAGPRSIESNVFGQALVAHTTGGRLSVVDAATLSVAGEIGGFGEPRYTAMHPFERIAYVSDSKRREIVVVDLARYEVVRRVGVPGPARHLSLSGDGMRLWTALGTRAATPRLVRIISPPFLAHDVVFAPDGRAWMTSGVRRSIAVYGVGASRPSLILPAAAAPQHVAFSGSRAYVASGDDGTVRVHEFDGSVIRAAANVPHGSYNIVFGGPAAPIGPVAATPSLDLGTVCLLSPGGSVRTVKKVARSAHDACLVEAG